MKKSMLLVAQSAVTGMLVAAPVYAADAVHHCKTNCAGKSACHSAQNACAGKNSCDGKGWLNAATEADCKKAGGKWDMANAKAGKSDAKKQKAAEKKPAASSDQEKPHK